MWVVEGVTEIQQREEQVALFPLGHLPHVQHHNRAKCVAHPDEYLRLRPLLHNRQQREKNGPNERTDQSSRNNTTK